MGLSSVWMSEVQGWSLLSRLCSQKLAPPYIETTSVMALQVPISLHHLSALHDTQRLTLVSLHCKDTMQVPISLDLTTRTCMCTPLDTMTVTVTVPISLHVTTSSDKLRHASTNFSLLKLQVPTSLDLTTRSTLLGSTSRHGAHPPPNPCSVPSSRSTTHIALHHSQELRQDYYRYLHVFHSTASSDQPLPAFSCR